MIFGRGRFRSGGGLLFTQGAKQCKIAFNLVRRPPAGASYPTHNLQEEQMKSITPIIVICILLLAACTRNASPTPESAKAGSTKPAASRAEEEASLRSTDIAWSEAAGKRDAEAVAGFMTDDGSTLPPNEPILTGKDAVRKGWQDMLSLKDSEVKWEPTQVQVSQSGDMGFTTGTYTLTFTDSSGSKVYDKGKYLVMWKKVDGKWKCYLDMYSSDMPAK
jgi:uncharacterized protein (TIGR02246 family)